MKLSLKKAQPAEAPAPSLAERIKAIRAEAEAIIEAEVLPTRKVCRSTGSARTSGRGLVAAAIAAAH
jgi:hypothetical protein